MPLGILLAISILVTACAGPRAESGSNAFARTPPWSYAKTPVDPFWWYDRIRVKPLHGLPKDHTGQNRIVAIVDTGFLKGHEAVANVKQGAGQCPGGASSDSDDINGHGTQLAGIVVGKDLYGRGDKSATGGIAPNATLIPIKIVCGVSTTAAVIWGIQTAVDAGADVVLLALGAWPSDQDVHQAILDKFNQNLWSSVLFVVASVWDSPAARPDWTKKENVLLVAAMTLDISGAEIVYSEKIGDVWAPGRDVETASIEGSSPKHNQFLMQGTSAAAAIVAGCAAAVKNGNELPLILKNRLLASVKHTVGGAPWPGLQPRLDCLDAAQ